MYGGQSELYLVSPAYIASESHATQMRKMLVEEQDLAAPFTHDGDVITIGHNFSRKVDRWIATTANSSDAAPWYDVR